MATVSSTTTGFFPTAKEGFITTTSSTTASGANTVGLNTVAGYSDGEYVTLVIEPTGGNSKQVFAGRINVAGTNVTGVTWTEGTNITHNAGVTVVDYETATAWALQRKGLLVTHNEDGTQKTNSITTASITDANVTTAKIADANVTAPKLGLSGNVLSQTNVGSAGGTIYYANLGGIKMAWGNTGSLTASGASPAVSAYTITWPTSFFTTVQSATLSFASGTVSNSASIYAAPNSAVTATGWTFYIASSNGSNGTTSRGDFFVVGT
jgi:hypothetical protein